MRVARALYVLSLALLAEYYPKVGRYPIYDWLALVALLIVLGRYTLTQGFPKPRMTIVTACTLFALGAMLTVPATEDSLSEAFSALLLLYMFGLWLPLASLLAAEWRHIRWMYQALGVAVVVTVGYAVGQRLLDWPFLGHGQFWGRMTGLTRHPNELGVFCAIAVPYQMCLAATSKGRAGRFGSAAAAMAAVVGVVLSGSMTGALALASGVVTYWLSTGRKARVRGLVLILVAGGVVAGATALAGRGGAPVVTNRMLAFVTTGSGRSTFVLRLVADWHAWQGIESTPVTGHGYNALVTTLGGQIEVHNTFLGAWYGGGVFTLLGMVVMLVGSFRALIRTSHLAGGTGYASIRAYIAAAVAGFVVLVVAMQVSPILYQRSSWIPVSLAFAVTALLRRTVSQDVRAHEYQMIGMVTTASVGP